MSEQKTIDEVCDSLSQTLRKMLAKEEANLVRLKANPRYASDKWYPSFILFYVGLIGGIIVGFLLAQI